MTEPIVTPEPQPTDPVEPTPQPQNTEPVKQWYEQVFTDDSLKSDESIKKYKSPDEFAKAFKEKDSMIGRKGVILPKDGDDKDLDRFYNQLGRPEQADKYKAPTIEVEDDLKSFYSEEKMNSFKTMAHKYGLTQKQFEGIAKEFTDSQLNEVRQIVAEENKRYEDATKELMQEWLVDYDAKSKDSELALKAFGNGIPQEKLELLMKDPHIKRLGYNIAKSVSEDKFKGGSSSHGADTIESLQSFINSQVHDSNSSYYNQKAPDHLAAKQKVREAYAKLSDLRKGAA